MSEAHRENLTELLSDLNTQYLDDIGADRGLPRAAIESLFARGFLVPDEAKSGRFVDEVAYPSELEKRLVNDGPGVKRILRMEEYIARKRRLVDWGPVPAIAVVHVTGSIIRGEERRSGLIGPNATGDESFRKMLEQVFGDTSVRAVVIRVNSGGGSATASDFMWHALLEMKKKYNKPLVFSFGNIAASGGYYIACTGDKIFSGGGTVTGSIGVVMGKVNLGKLYATLGVNKDVIKMSEFADIFDESRELSTRERELLQKAVDFTYRGFTEKVSKGRGISKENIPGVAEGRVFAGSRAKERALVDSIGGLVAAIEYAKGMAGVERRCRVLHLPSRRSSVVEMLGSATAGDALAAIEPIRNALQNLYHGDEAWLFLYPYRIEIK
jgi:protease-4